MTIDRFYKAQEALRLIDVTSERLKTVTIFADALSKNPTTSEIALKTGVVIGGAPVYEFPITVKSDSLQKLVEEHKLFWQAKLDEAQKKFDEI